MWDSDKWLSLAQVAGTQVIIVYAIDRGARLLNTLAGHQNQRRQQWLMIQRDIELEKIRTGNSMFGPKEIRVSAASSAEGLSTRLPEASIG